MPPRRTPRNRSDQAAPQSTNNTSNNNTEEEDVSEIQPLVQEPQTQPELVHGQPRLPAPADESSSEDRPIPESTTALRLNESTGRELEDGRSVRADRRPLQIDRTTRLHAWNENPETEVNFDREVVQAGAARRADTVRWETMLRNEGRDSTVRMWHQFTRRNYLFRVPLTIPLARTFAQSNVEARYVDSMARALIELSVIRNIHDIPLFILRDPVLSRWWNAFYTPAGHTAEADLRFNDGELQPG